MMTWRFQRFRKTRSSMPVLSQYTHAASSIKAHIWHSALCQSIASLEFIPVKELSRSSTNLVSGAPAACRATLPARAQFAPRDGCKKQRTCSTIYKMYLFEHNSLLCIGHLLELFKLLLIRPRIIEHVQFCQCQKCKSCISKIKMPTNYLNTAMSSDILSTNFFFFVRKFLFEQQAPH